MDRLSSTGHDIIVSVVAMAIVASIAVFLRLGAKRLTKAGLTVDDYWIMFALVSFWVYVGVMLWGTCFHIIGRKKLTPFTMKGMFNGAGGESMTNITHFKFSGYQIFLKVQPSFTLTEECNTEPDNLVVYSHRHPAIWHHDHWCETLALESLSPHILGSMGSAVFNCLKRPLRPLADCHRRGFDFRLFFHS